MFTMDADEARKNPVLKKQLSHLGDDFQVEPLYSGDFAALDTPLTFGAERKTFPNLAASLGSGELDEQLSRLLGHYDFPVLIVEGMPEPNARGKLKLWGAKREVAYPWVVGALAGWYARGVAHWQTRNARETATCLLILYRFCTKPDHREFYSPRRLTPNLRPMSLAARIMSQFAGVGPKRAAQFDGLAPHELSGWDEAEWQTALGTVTGRKVHEAWQGRTT